MCRPSIFVYSLSTMLTKTFEKSSNRHSGKILLKTTVKAHGCWVYHEYQQQEKPLQFNAWKMYGKVITSFLKVPFPQASSSTHRHHEAAGLGHKYRQGSD